MTSPTLTRPAVTPLTRTGRFVRSTEMTLLVIGLAGSAALVAGSGGSLLSGAAVRGVLAYLAVPILIGLAQMVVLGIGQLNLSVGAMGGFISVFMASLMVKHGLPASVAIVIGLALGAGIGAANGLLMLVTRVNGFVVTLATMTILLGLQYRVAGTETVDGYSPGLRSLGSATIANIPVIFLLALAVAGVLALFIRRTAPGRRMLASGGNPLAARLSGISNDRVLVLAHALSGLIIGIAAVVTVASAPGVNKSIGGDWLLPSFAAPIIGGVVMTGGVVSVLGTVVAAYIIRLVDVARAQFSLDPSWVNFAIGAVVLGTVIISRVRETRRTSGRPS
jgi:ribose transport system permease protein